jgi:hypothetical protein
MTRVMVARRRSVRVAGTPHRSRPYAMGEGSPKKPYPLRAIHFKEDELRVKRSRFSMTKRDALLFEMYCSLRVPGAGGQANRTYQDNSQTLTRLSRLLGVFKRIEQRINLFKSIVEVRGNARDIAAGSHVYIA